MACEDREKRRMLTALLVLLRAWCYTGLMPTQAASAVECSLMGAVPCMPAPPNGEPRWANCPGPSYHRGASPISACTRLPWTGEPHHCSSSLVVNAPLLHIGRYKTFDGPAYDPAKEAEKRLKVCRHVTAARDICAAGCAAQPICASCPPPCSTGEACC